MVLSVPLLSWLLLAAASQEPEPAPAVTAVEEEEAWSLSLGIYVFGRPEDDAYAMPIVKADRGPLHLELRYNYEEIDAGSLFVGRNFELGDEAAVAATITPMLGFVMGSLEGVAPGLLMDVAWKGLGLYSESEYLVDFGGEDDFLYTWSELTYSPADWVRFGLSAQRTRLFEQELEVDRGFLLGFAVDRFWLDLYLFNPDGDEPYGGFGVGVDF